VLSKVRLTQRAPDLGYAPVFWHFSWLGRSHVSRANPPSHPKRVTPAVRKTRGFFSATGVLKYRLANHPVLLTMYFIGLWFLGKGVLSKKATVN
jgi:hypothetical protein